MNKYFKALMGISPATLVRGIRFGVRDIYHVSRANFMAANPLENRQFKSIPTITLENILGVGTSLIKLKVMKYEDGMLPVRDAIALLSILVAEQAGEILEIGTYMGHTTRAMAENLPEAIVHTIDLPAAYSTDQPQHALLPKDDFHLIRRRIVGREFKNQTCESRIVQHLGDTADLDFTKIGTPGFFFIDGSHTYEYCKNDSEKCLALCHRKGVFLWHDCDETHPGVVRFISEWRAAGRNIVRIEGTGLAYWKSS
jgi:hypothetical protein